MLYEEFEAEFEEEENITLSFAGPEGNNVEDYASEQDRQPSLGQMQTTSPPEPSSQSAPASSSSSMDTSLLCPPPEHYKVRRPRPPPGLPHKAASDEESPSSQALPTTRTRGKGQVDVLQPPAPLCE